MSVRILSGKPVAQAIISKLMQQTERTSFRPFLKIIRTTNRADSDSYIRQKVKLMEKLGFGCVVESAESEKLIRAAVEKANEDKGVTGILVQLPLASPSMNPRPILDAIDPLKDIDGLSVINAGRLFSGNPLIFPCTPQAVISILDHYEIGLEGKKVAVIGRSLVVGLPLFQLLNQRNATVTLLHSHSNLDSLHNFEIVVSAVGRSELIKDSMLSPGAILIDVGISRREDGKLVGDVEKGISRAGAVTPVPGGVGPVTVAMLARNLWQCHELQNIKY